MIRSCGWWVYVVYLPIFCIEAGLGDKVGGIALSLTNALLFAAPLLPAGAAAVGAARGARGVRRLRRRCSSPAGLLSLALGRRWG